MKKENNSLPVIGLGPLIVGPQIILTLLALLAQHRGHLKTFNLPIPRPVPLIPGLLLIILGLALWISANFQSKIVANIKENSLVTDGVYAWVRHPIYASFFYIGTGFSLASANLILLLIPPLAWAYMSLVVKHTEEKWLVDLYGQAYQDYQARVNPFIPKISLH